MKTLFREYKQATRRLLLNAFGALAVLATGGGRAARAAAPGRKGAPVQELCVECLAKRAMQRGAFINKWV